MSLEHISNKDTIETVDPSGVTWWKNPNISVKINSNGEVYNRRGVKLKPKDNMYITYIKCPDVKSSRSNAYSFNSLFSRMVLGESLKGRTLRLKDETTHFTKDNVEIVPLHSNHYSKSTEFVQLKNTNPNIKYYTKHQCKDKYITEDSAIFPTKELAEWHQDSVIKGKENAQIVLDYNGGYSLAEKIYLQEVVYNKEKPYKHFIDVMKNDKGVVCKKGKDYCVFDKLSGAGITSLSIYGLNKLKGLICTEDQAIEINEAVLNYTTSFDNLIESIDSLTILLKDFK